MLQLIGDLHGFDLKKGGPRPRRGSYSEVATILLTEHADARYVQPRPIRTRDRLWVWCRAWQLDHALARGARPDSGVALSLRAHRLIGPNSRRALADELRALPREAVRPRNRLHAGVAICRRGVVQAAGLLEELADRLEGPEPVEARAVAQVRVLLRSGASPLFDPNGAQELVGALQTTLDVLERRVAV